MSGHHVIAAILVAMVTCSVRADIYRWDTGEVIPGTEGITPGRGVALDGLDLQFANLAGTNLDWATLQGANLSNADVRSSRLTNANLAGANLSRSDMTGANLNHAALTNANMTDATILGANFETFENGISQDQIKSTANYKSGNLQGLQLAGVDFTNFSFAGQDLTGTSFVRLFLDNYVANLTDADFTDAIVEGVDFRFALQDPEQLYATASYKAKDLRGIVTVNSLPSLRGVLRGCGGGGWRRFEVLGLGT